MESFTFPLKQKRTSRSLELMSAGRNNPAASISVKGGHLEFWPQTPYRDPCVVAVSEVGVKSAVAPQALLGNLRARNTWSSDEMRACPFLGGFLLTVNPKVTIAWLESLINE